MANFATISRLELSTYLGQNRSDLIADGLGVEAQEQIRVDRPLLDMAFTTKVQDRVDRSGPIRLEGERERVAIAVVALAVDEGRQRDDPLVACPCRRVERDDPREIRSLMPQLGGRREIAEDEIEQVG